ncbi:hypothetical protein [Crenobacter cavernae]|uniref:hypothetical protein n=1 Tax=Crenobacter cavernae TaxID=2290923 RepID=UPI001FE6AF4D|nr:hypothetical protein [Crenobacter cavernae]
MLSELGGLLLMLLVILVAAEVFTNALEHLGAPLMLSTLSVCLMALFALKKRGVKSSTARTASSDTSRRRLSCSASLRCCCR